MKIIFEGKRYSKYYYILYYFWIPYTFVYIYIYIYIYINIDINIYIYIYIYMCVCVCVCVYLPAALSTTSRMRQNSSFYAGFNRLEQKSFDSPRQVTEIMVKMSRLSNYLPGGWLVIFITFPRLLIPCEMQTA